MKSLTKKIVALVLTVCVVMSMSPPINLIAGVGSGIQRASVSASYIGTMQCDWWWEYCSIVLYFDTIMYDVPGVDDFPSSCTDEESMKTYRKQHFRYWLSNECAQTKDSTKNKVLAGTGTGTVQAYMTNSGHWDVETKFKKPSEDLLTAFVANADNSSDPLDNYLASLGTGKGAAEKYIDDIVPCFKSCTNEDKKKWKENLKNGGKVPIVVCAFGVYGNLKTDSGAKQQKYQFTLDDLKTTTKSGVFQNAYASANTFLDTVHPVKPDTLAYKRPASVLYKDLSASAGLFLAGSDPNRYMYGGVNLCNNSQFSVTNSITAYKKKGNGYESIKDSSGHIKKYFGRQYIFPYTCIEAPPPPADLEIAYAMSAQSKYDGDPMAYPTEDLTDSFNIYVTSYVPKKELDKANADGQKALIAMAKDEFTAINNVCTAGLSEKEKEDAKWELVAKVEIVEKVDGKNVFNKDGIKLKGDAKFNGKKCTVTGDITSLTVTKELSFKQVKKLINGEPIKLQYTIPSSKAEKVAKDKTVKYRHYEKLSVILKSPKPGKYKAGGTGTNNKGEKFEDKAHAVKKGVMTTLLQKEILEGLDGWASESKTNYAQWKYSENGIIIPTPDIPDIPKIVKPGDEAPGQVHKAWLYSTANKPVYAEIVANCVGTKSGTSDGLASDWNVSQGIPSTENISIAIGGSIFKIGIGGYVHSEGQRYANIAELNNGLGTKPANPAATRTITFKCDITDIWGNNNPRCVLGCRNHTICSGGTSFTVQTTGTKSWSGTGECSGSASPGVKVCPKCGETVTATCSGHSAKASHKDKDGNEIPDPCSCSCSCSESHDCTWTLQYNCKSDSCSYSSRGGDSKASESWSGYLNSYKQSYNSGTVTVTNGNETVTGSWTRDNLLEKGYTTGTGCYCTTTNERYNMMHHGTDMHKFTLQEHIDMYAYREIMTAQIDALMSAEVADVNESVIDADSANKNGSTSNTNLKASLWRANGSYKSMNGRIWFTQFKDEKYKNGDGWTNSWVDTPNYWLGDCTVCLVGVCDQSIGQAAEDTVSDDVTISKHNGQSNAHWIPTDSNSTSTDFMAAEPYCTGDTSTKSETKAQAAQMVNAWMCANNVPYTANIISDTLDISVAGTGKAQNILAETYAIDNGILLFDGAFTNSKTTIHRTHHNRLDHLTENCDTLISKAYWRDYVDIDVNMPDSTMTVGYNGTVTSDVDTKYSIDGTTRLANEAITQSLVDGVNMKQYTNNGEVWTQNPSGTIQGNNTVYQTETAETSTTSGVLNVNMTTETVSQSPQTYLGYYTTFAYPNLGTYTAKAMVNSTLKKEVSVANNGLGNMLEYANINSNGGEESGYGWGEYSHDFDGSLINNKNALVISNIKLNAFAANGEYDTLRVKGNYYNILSLNNETTHKYYKGTTTGCSKSNCAVESRAGEEYANFTDLDTGLNHVVIHDPICVDKWQVIGNSYGDYDGAGPAMDDTGEDFRTVTANMNEANKANYGVIGNSIHVWVTDVGDFGDGKGSTMPNYNGSTNLGIGSTANGIENFDTGVVNHNAKGYVNNMNTGLWTKNRYVSFDFPVGYYTLSGGFVSLPAGQLVDLATVRVNRPDGYGSISTLDNGIESAIKKTNGNEMHAPTAELQNANSWDGTFIYGADYEFMILTSANEATSTGVHFYNRAINSYNIDNNQDSINTARGSGLIADDYVQGIATIQMVGRIGNLALEDTGDFRFSELFKETKQPAEWLIKGVTYKVDSSAPKLICSVQKDIIGNPRGNSMQNKSHSTLSVTSYLLHGTYDHGKAGDWIGLPLTASANPIEEFKTEQMRMGYAAYFDIETIGDYYGLNYNVKVDPSTGEVLSKTFNEGAKSVNDDNNPDFVDGREYKMDITPHYFLYDVDEGEFYAIDLYAGTTSDYTKFYSSTDGANVTHMNESSVYIDLPHEDKRRNVTAAEKTVTQKVLQHDEHNHAAMNKPDYIGTSMKMTLDANDLDYIGSAYMYGAYNDTDDSMLSLGLTGEFNQLAGNANMVTGPYKDKLTLRAQDFQSRSQRWYFTLQVPSSTIATYTNVSIGNQADIVKSHKQLKKEHPHSVIVCLGEIAVRGNVWELTYDARMLNDGVNSFSLYGTVPTGWDPTGNVVTLDDSTTAKVPGGFDIPIDPRWAPLVVYDGFETSSSDLDTYGTH